MYKIFGNTSPFLINLIDDEMPFSMDEYFEIGDNANNNPICRVIKTWAAKEDEKSAVQYFATAKIETSITKPINPESMVFKPSITKLEKYLLPTSPNNGLLLGQIEGTEEARPEYQNLMLIKTDNGFEKQKIMPFVFDFKKMSEYPHVAIFGGSGSGKTVAIKCIVEEATRFGIPMIILDPHLEMDFKNDFSNHMFDDIRRVKDESTVKTFNIGKEIGISFTDLNGDELASIISASSKTSDAMETALKDIFTPGEMLSNLKNKLELLRDAIQKRYNGDSLDDDEEKMLARYGKSIASSSTVQAILWRLSSVESSGIFSCGLDDIISAISNQKICVVRGSVTQLNLLTGYMVSKFYKMRRDYIDNNSDAFNPFIVAMDESHLFCPKSDDFSPAKNILKTIAQEGRKYGVFEIMATQRPALLDTTIVAQASTKMIFRLSVKEDLSTVQKETDLTEDEVKRLPYMASGECYVSSPVFGRTIAVKIRCATTVPKVSSNPFDELRKIPTLSPEKQAIMANLPITNIDSREKLKEINNGLENKMSVPELMKHLEELSDAGKVLKTPKVFGFEYSKN